VADLETTNLAVFASNERAGGLTLLVMANGVSLEEMHTSTGADVMVSAEAQRPFCQRSISVFARQ
jgi:acyl CoA:acetate/3-ketoacid CoA transferase beta subunit